MDFISWETVISLCLGIGLAASSGFRIFLPMFVLSIAAHFGGDYIHLSDTFSWIGSVPAMITFGIAVLVEIFAYFIPVVDNMLDAIAIPLAAIAGTFLVGATLLEMNDIATWALAIIAGGGTATAISSTTAATRVVSTTTTGGIGNFLVNSGETFGASFLSILSVIFAPLAIVLVLLILFSIYKVWKKIREKGDDLFEREFSHNQPLTIDEDMDDDY